MIYLGVAICLILIAGISFKMGVDEGAKIMLDFLKEEALKNKGLKEDK